MNLLPYFAFLRTDCDDWLHRQPEYILEELGPWRLGEEDRYLLAPDPFSTPPGSTNVWYDISNRIYFFCDGTCAFQGQPPTADVRGYPPMDHLGDWLDSHGGVDAIHNAVPQKHQPLALQWNPNSLRCFGVYSDVTMIPGNWELLQHDPDDGGWMIYVNERGEEGEP